MLLLALARGTTNNAVVTVNLATTGAILEVDSSTVLFVDSQLSTTGLSQGLSGVATDSNSDWDI